VFSFASQKRMECRYLLEHLLITFACSSKPARRGEVCCAVKKWFGYIFGKLDLLFLYQAFWVEVEIPESCVSGTYIRWGER